MPSRKGKQLSGTALVSATRRCLTIDPAVGVLHRSRAYRDTKGVNVGDVAGSPATHGGMQVMMLGGVYSGRRLAWILYNGTDPGHEIRQVNGDECDNRESNLYQRRQGVANNARGRMADALQRAKRGENAFLRQHLEQRFVDGMTWENHPDEWHVDHLIPVSLMSSMTTDPAVINGTWNLFPLPAYVNGLKGGGLDLRALALAEKQVTEGLKNPHGMKRRQNLVEAKRCVNQSFDLLVDLEQRLDSALSTRAAS